VAMGMDSEVYSVTSTTASGKNSSLWLRWAKFLMIGLAVVISVFSLRYLTGSVSLAPVDVRASMVKNGSIFIAHAVFAAVALFTGSLQFLDGLRSKYPKVHRWAGRVYVVACMVGGLTALVIAPDVKSGEVATWGFSLLAVLWIGTTLAGWRFATTGNFASHKRLMIRSYGLTAAGISLRLQIAGFALAGFSYTHVSDFLSFSCWVPTLLLIELWLASLTLRRSQAVRT
jgi:uncharacterized membrane protein